MEMPIDIIKAAVDGKRWKEIGRLREITAFRTRWQGGKLVFEPFDAAQQRKEVPVNAFSKRSRRSAKNCAVLEQKISTIIRRLSQEDKAEFQPVDYALVWQPDNF